MVLTEKELKKNNNRIAIVTTPYRVVLKPNERKNIPTHTDMELRHPTTTTLIHETDDASIPDFVDVAPGIVNFAAGHRNSFNITLSN